MESVKGCTKDIQMRVQAMCDRCDGRGGEPGTQTHICPYCRGTGQVSGCGQWVWSILLWLV